MLKLYYDGFGIMVFQSPSITSTTKSLPDINLLLRTITAD